MERILSQLHILFSTTGTRWVSSQIAAPGQQIVLQDQIVKCLTTLWYRSGVGFPAIQLFCRLQLAPFAERLHLSK
jgi:hypothetical protein